MQLKHNAELSVTINVFAGILTKQLLRKADNVLKSMAASSLQNKTILGTNEEELSDLSESLHQNQEKINKEPCVCFYPCITNKKGKHIKNQEDALCVICSQ